MAGFGGLVDGCGSLTASLDELQTLPTSEVSHSRRGVLGMNVMNHWLESPSELCTFERITEPVARYRRSVSGRGRNGCGRQKRLRGRETWRNLVMARGEVALT
jgi:hypothetical protein